MQQHVRPSTSCSIISLQSISRHPTLLSFPSALKKTHSESDRSRRKQTPIVWLRFKPGISCIEHYHSSPTPHPHPHPSPDRPTLARVARLPLRSNFRFSGAPNRMSSQRTRQLTSAMSARRRYCLHRNDEARRMKYSHGWREIVCLRRDYKLNGSDKLIRISCSSQIALFYQVFFKY